MHKRLIFFAASVVGMVGIVAAQASTTRPSNWRTPLNADALSGSIRLEPLKARLVIAGRTLSFTDRGESWSVDQRGQGTLRRVADQQLLYSAPDRTQYFFAPAKAGLEQMTQSHIGGQASYFVATEAHFSGGEIWRWVYIVREIRENCEAKGRFGLTNPECRIRYFQRPDAIVSNRGLMLKGVYASPNPGADFNRLVGLTVHDASRCGTNDTCLRRAPIIKRVKVAGSTALR